MSTEFIITFLLYIAAVNIIYSYFDFTYDFDDSIAYEIEMVLNEKLIYSFEPKEKCDKDEKPLLFGKWKGLHVGCYCPTTGIMKRRCTYKLKDALCKNMPEVHPIYYENININFSNKKICVKRTKERYRDYLLNNQIIEKNEACPEDYKCCGIVDTLNRKLCVKLNEQCPITIDEINGLKKDNYENSQILSIVKITESKPCMNPNEKDWQSFFTLDYPFKKCSKINNNLYDDRYEKLNNFITDKYDLYKYNNILNYYPEHIQPLFKFQKLYLWGRNFIGIKKEDIKEFSYDKLLIYEKITNRFYSYIWGISIFSLLFLIAASLQARSFNPQVIMNNNKAAPYLMGVFILVIINIIINLILLVYNLKMKTIIVLEGNDAYTRGIINNFRKEINTHINFNIASLIIFLIFIIYIIKTLKNFLYYFFDN